MMTINITILESTKKAVNALLLIIIILFRLVILSVIPIKRELLVNKLIKVIFRIKTAS